MTSRSTPTVSGMPTESTNDIRRMPQGPRATRNSVIRASKHHCSGSRYHVYLMCKAIVLMFTAAAVLAAQDRIVPSDSGFDGFATTIPMRDGKALAADLYRPRSSGRYPVVLIQTPYNKSLMRPWWAGVGQYGKDSLFTDTRYAFVVTDRRGRYGSKSAEVPGGQQPWLGQDGFDTIAWIAKQDWSNGKVATWGASALAVAQYETARENPPALVSAVPHVMTWKIIDNSY